MCKQKYLGEKCQFQSDLYGPKYFTNMDYFGYNNIYYDSNDNKKECFQSSSSNIPSEYLETCDCPLECKTEEFPVDISTSDFGSFREVNIFYDQMKETVITEEPKTSLGDLISNLGGIVGLFTGASFLSIIEFVEIGVLAAILYSDFINEQLTGNVHKIAIVPPNFSGRPKKGHLIFDACFECGIYHILGEGSLNILFDYLFSL
jgi:hypothetical protein